MAIVCQHYHWQFENGPAVIVNNTFLDVVNVLDMHHLRRYSSAPPAVGVPLLRDNDSGSSCGDDESDSDEDLADVADVEDQAAVFEVSSGGEDLHADELAPSPPELCRLRTHDAFEHGEQWAQQSDAQELCGGGGFPIAVWMMMPSVAVLAHQTSPVAYAQAAATERLLEALLEDAPIAAALPVAMPVAAPHSAVSQLPAEHLAALTTMDMPAAPLTMTVGQSGGCDEDSPHDESRLALPPQHVERSMNASGVLRVDWTVDAKKLRGNDRVTVSPPFELVFGAGATFKMLISPSGTSGGKGGASFRKAKGKGTVQIKCDVQTDNFWGGAMNFRISTCSGRWKGAKEEPPRGPVCHNFYQSGLCGLPRDQEAWNFHDVVDEASQTFVVCLELLPILA